MRRELAERLLEKLMDWSGAEKAQERAYLESFAAYKYDEYQQFSPGLRFLESLALWLRQFETPKDRRIAYDFVRDRLIFISETEMTHLVELAFPTFVRPKLLKDTAEGIEVSPHRVQHLISTNDYRLRLRKTLVLGLSDGARTDRFRRANPQDITNEQIWHAYDVSDAKAEDLQNELTENLTALLTKTPELGTDKFNTVVLLDDFTASGTSYLRFDADQNKWKGKIAKIVKRLEQADGLGAVIAADKVSVIVVIYVAAPQAIEHIENQLKKLPFSRGSISFNVVHTLSADTKVEPDAAPEFYKLMDSDAYFDPKADDDHVKIAGETVRYGYADCKLPVVLAHNTPNNSLFLLWAEEVLKVHGLFPRVSRHRTFEQ